jgi:drug/metabolite transporter (DMT)-like permease
VHFNTDKPLLSQPLAIDPVFCWVLGLVLFDEKMTTSAAIGATIILASGIILTHFAQKK